MFIKYNTAFSGSLWVTHDSNTIKNSSRVHTSFLCHLQFTVEKKGHGSQSCQAQVLEVDSQVCPNRFPKEINCFPKPNFS